MPSFQMTSFKKFDFLQHSMKHRGKNQNEQNTGKTRNNREEKIDINVEDDGYNLLMEH